MEDRRSSRTPARLLVLDRTDSRWVGGRIVIVYTVALGNRCSALSKDARQDRKAAEANAGAAGRTKGQVGRCCHSLTLHGPDRVCIRTRLRLSVRALFDEAFDGRSGQSRGGADDKCNFTFEFSHRANQF